MHDLVDRRLTNHFFQNNKLCGILIAVIWLGMAVYGFFIENDKGSYWLFWGVIAALFSLLFLGAWFGIRRVYGNKLSFCDGIVTLYNRKNKKIRSFALATMKSDYREVKFPGDGYIRFVCKTCLVLYENIELYESIEYWSDWKDPNIIIIQNPELIKIMEELLKQRTHP